MPYVYRYIDMTKQEVCYVGKVTRVKDVGYDPLRNRHEQHKRESWYREIGDSNICMQFIETKSHTDADIMETWLINFYCQTGQLVNKGKTEWGYSNIDLHGHIFGYWHTYDDYAEKTNKVIRTGSAFTKCMEYGNTSLYDRLYKEYSTALQEAIEAGSKALRIHRLDAQADFTRR